MMGMRKVSVQGHFGSHGPIFLAEEKSRHVTQPLCLLERQ